jgi:hypothetical protein
MSDAFTMRLEERTRGLKGPPKLRALEKQMVSGLY